MPSFALVQAGSLRWDGRGGWRDPSGTIQIIDPWWWSSDEPFGLFVRPPYLDAMLDGAGQALVLMGFQAKFIAGMDTGPGRLTERTLFMREGGAIKQIKRTVKQD
jgi:hypothetical protein